MTTRDRTMLLVVALVAIVGGFWMLVLAPRREEAARLSDQVAAARTELAQANELAAQAARPAAALRDPQGTLARLGQALPADDQMASLIYQLQDAAGRSKVRFGSIQPSGANGAPAGSAPSPASAAAPGTVPGPAGVSQLPLQLVFDGRYADLERFLRRVHGFTSVRGDTIRVHGRLLSVQGVQLAAAPSGFPHIRATITATAYQAPVAAPPAPAPAPAGTPADSTAPAGSAAPPTTPAVVGAAG